MEQIRSKISGKVLHVVYRSDDFIEGRENIIAPDNFIQCSALKMKEGTTFRAHKHIHRKKTLNLIAQESWVVIKGVVRCFFYDINDVLLTQVVLHAGDASFTLSGGHTYEVIEDAIVYEMKTGPYEGQEKDKVFI